MVGRGYVSNEGRGYVIQNNESGSNEGGYRAARAAKNYLWVHGGYLWVQGGYLWVQGGYLWVQGSYLGSGGLSGWVGDIEKKRNSRQMRFRDKRA